MNYRLFLIGFLLGTSTCSSTGSTLLSNADTLNRLSALYTALYGPAHPFNKQISVHRSFIAQHTRSVSRTTRKRSLDNMNTTVDLQVTLDTLRDYAQTILAQYRVTQEDGTTTSLATAPLSATPHISAQPGSSPAHIDATLQQYLQILLALQQHHPNESAVAHQKKVRAAQLRVIGFGTLALLLITAGIRFFGFQSLRINEQTNSSYEELTESAWDTAGAARGLNERIAR